MVMAPWQARLTRGEERQTRCQVGGLGHGAAVAGETDQGRRAADKVPGRRVWVQVPKGKNQGEERRGGGLRWE